MLKPFVGLLLCLGCACARSQGVAVSSFVEGSAADEAQIRSIVRDASAERPNPHVAPDLDWENAFGIRYNNLKTRDAFYKDAVAPLQKDDADTTLEVKVRFLTPDAAVADEYWHIVGQLDMDTHKPGPDRWGRTTYIFTKKDGVWTEVLERVADLRLAYYKHYDHLPQSAAVPPATLASLAGKYQLVQNRVPITLSVEGDHLLYTSPKRTRVLVPLSATEFLAFDPADTAEYLRLVFSRNAAGRPLAHITYDTGEAIDTLERLP